MKSQSTLRNPVVICFCMLLLLTSSVVYAQEDVQDADASSVSVEREVNVSDVPVSEDAGSPDATKRVFLPSVQGGSDGSVEATEVNFTYSWFFSSCSNVLTSEQGFWDDMPGAGEYNESGLLWFVENSTATEGCTYYSNIASPGISTTTYPQLRFRVAVNDGARFRVMLYRYNAGVCNTFLTSYTTQDADDTSDFLTFSVNLPAGLAVCRVYVTLDDYPDNNTSLRTSALIDYIRIRNPISGVAGWNESMTRAN